MGLKCPECGLEQLMVIDSRPVEDCIRRRRECMNCGHRFTTYESSQIRKKSELLEDIKDTLLINIAGTVNQVIADAREADEHG